MQGVLYAKPHQIRPKIETIKTIIIVFGELEEKIIIETMNEQKN